MQIVLVRVGNFHFHQVSRFRFFRAIDVNETVDFWGVRAASGNRVRLMYFVHQYSHAFANFFRELGGADSFLHSHETRTPFLLHLFRDLIRQRVGRRATHRRVGEAADAVELRLLQKFQQLLELRFGLAGKTDDEGAADRDIGTDSRQRLMRARLFSELAGRFMAFRMRGLAC